MEPSQIFGVAEECHSSESGWTMYIGSPVNSSTDADEDDGGEEISTDEDAEDHDYSDAINDDESDDSMASDASSGPSNQGHSLTLFNRKKKSLMGKKKMEKKEEEEEREDEPVLMAKNGKACSAQSSGRVKKTSWMTKTTRNN